MSRRPGVFDPWRQEPAPEVAPADPSGFATDGEPEAAGEEICIPLYGERAGVHVWVPGTLGVADANERLVSALELVPEGVRTRHTIHATPGSSPSVSVKAGEKQFFCLAAELKAAVDLIASALMEACAENPQIAARVEKLRVVPFHR